MYVIFMMIKQIPVHKFCFRLLSNDYRGSIVLEFAALNHRVPLEVVQVQ
jgi:hypothetical protein